MSILTHVWTRDNDIVAGCPAVTIIDGMPGIVAGTASGDLVALDGTGTELWRQSIGARVSTWPVVDDVPGTGRCILAADYAGMIACMTPDGENVWRTQLKGGLNEYNSVSVVRGGATAFVASSRCGVVTGLSVDGAIAWEFHTHPEHYTRKVGTGTGPCAIGDVDGDGRDEIAFSAADGYLYCLDCDGGFRWNLYIGDNSQYSSPVMMQLDAGPCVLCGGNADVVYAVSGDGQVVWSQRGTGAGYMDVALSVGDINGDGKDEVVFVHQGRALQAMNGRGEMLWSRFDYLGGDQSFGPSLADIDGDGNLELLFTQRGGETLFVIDGNGELLEEHEMNGGMLGAPVVADVDGDGLLEVLTVSQSDGELRCFDTAASAVPGSAPWPTSRGSFDGRANRLGDVVAVTPRSITAPETTHLTRNSPDSVRLGMNDISFDADPPLGESALIEISALGQDGIVKRAVTQGEDRDCLRLEVLEPGEQMLTATAIDAESWRRTGLSEEHIDVGEFAEERGSAVELLAALRFDDQSSGDLRKELDRIHRRMRFRWAEIEEQIAAYEDLPQEARRELISDVNRELARLRREVGCQAVRIRTSSQMGKPVDFLPWETGHPWVPFDPETDIPPDDLLSDLSIRTDGRAHEAVAVEFAMTVRTAGRRANPRYMALRTEVWYRFRACNTHGTPAS